MYIFIYININIIYILEQVEVHSVRVLYILETQVLKPIVTSIRNLYVSNKIIQRIQNRNPDLK